MAVNPLGLAAEAELWIGAGKYVITKAFNAYIPPNIEPEPLIIRNMSK